MPNDPEIIYYQKTNENREYKISDSNSGSGSGSRGWSYGTQTSATPEQIQTVLNNLPAMKPYKFTYVDNVNAGTDGWIIDFDNPTSPNYLDIARMNQILDDVFNNYDPGNYRGYLNYARGQADIARHECGPTHDENVKWRLRDINNNNLRPRLDTINRIQSAIASEANFNTLNSNQKLANVVNKLNSRLQKLYDYNANTLGTVKQINDSINAHYSKIFRGIENNIAMIRWNDMIVEYDILNYKKLNSADSNTSKMIDGAISNAQDASGQLWKTTKDKVKKYNNDIKDQNDLLTDKINKVSDYYTKNERNFEYQQKNIPYLANIKNGFFITYYVLIFILVIFCIYAKTRAELIWRIVFIAFLAILPFIAHIVELYLYNIGAYLYSFLLNKPFNNDNVDYGPTKGMPYKGDVLAKDHVKIADGYEKELADPTNSFDDLQKNRPLYFSRSATLQYMSDKLSGIFDGLNFSNAFNALANGG
jgi:hypothetical protein